MLDQEDTRPATFGAGGSGMTPRALPTTGAELLSAAAEPGRRSGEPGDLDERFRISVRDPQDGMRS